MGRGRNWISVVGGEKPSGATLILPDYPAMHGNAEREQWDSMGAWYLPYVQCPLKPSSWISVRCAVCPADIAHMDMKTCGLEDHEDCLLFF